MGIHPFGDPALSDDFDLVPLTIDAREPHVYAAEWEPGESRFLVDGELVRTVPQAPGYPLQLMLSLYEFPVADDPRPAEAYPKACEVDWVRGYRPAG